MADNLKSVCKQKVSGGWLCSASIDFFSLLSVSAFCLIWRWLLLLQVAWITPLLKKHQLSYITPGNCMSNKSKPFPGRDSVSQTRTYPHACTHTYSYCLSTPHFWEGASFSHAVYSSELQDIATIILKCHFHLLPWEASLVCAICFSAQAARGSEKKPQQLCLVLREHWMVKAMVGSCPESLSLSRC